MTVWDTNNARALAALNPNTGKPVEFGGEAFNEAWNFVKREEQSTSLNNAMQARYDSYLDEVEQVTGERLPNPMSPFDNVKFLPDQPVPAQQINAHQRAMALDDLTKKAGELKQLYPEMPLPPDPEGALLDVVETSAELRQEYAALRSRMTAGGATAAFLGSMVGVATDPPVLASLPFGAAAGTGILGTMAAEAAIATAIEIPIQAIVFDNKRTLGSPYTLTEAAANVALAGVGAGGLAGLVKGIGRGGSAAVEAWRRRNAAAQGRPARQPTAQEVEGATILERESEIASDSPLPRDVGNDVAHQRAFAEAFEQATFGRPLRGDTALTPVRRPEVLEEVATAPTAVKAEVPEPRLNEPVQIPVRDRQNRIRQFRTEEKANAAARKTGSVVVPDGDRFTLRKNLAGDLVRQPDGTAQTFRSARGAQRFADDQDLTDTTVITLPPEDGKPLFALGRGFSEDEAAALNREVGNAVIPPRPDRSARASIEADDAALQAQRQERRVQAQRVISEIAREQSERVFALGPARTADLETSGMVQSSAAVDAARNATLQEAIDGGDIPGSGAGRVGDRDFVGEDIGRGGFDQGAVADGAELSNQAIRDPQARAAAARATLDRPVTEIDRAINADFERVMNENDGDIDMPDEFGDDVKASDLLAESTERQRVADEVTGCATGAGAAAA
ncbi:MAG: hypothetical protein ACR2QF_02985 [Geminicoccaceae bacterium]